MGFIDKFKKWTTEDEYEDEEDEDGGAGADPIGRRRSRLQGGGVLSEGLEIPVNQPESGGEGHQCHNVLLDKCINLFT